jgi:hypothetical protein
LGRRLEYVPLSSQMARGGCEFSAQRGGGGAGAADDSAALGLKKSARCRSERTRAEPGHLAGVDHTNARNYDGGGPRVPPGWQARSRTAIL